jgi:hypothetical protein
MSNFVLHCSLMFCVLVLTLAHQWPTIEEIMFSVQQRENNKINHNAHDFNEESVDDIPHDTTNDDSSKKTNDSFIQVLNYSVHLHIVYCLL